MPDHDGPATSPLILASSSPYRRELLARLGLPFTAVAPAVDEAVHPGEGPAALATRLAERKAAAVAREHPQAWVIGSDQVASLGSRVFGKPGGRAQAIAQLEAVSGQTLSFHTGLCLRQEASGTSYCVCAGYEIRFRTLDRAQIERYVDRDQPFDCAGSLRAEGLGISLLEAMHGDDPTTLIGLPLIHLTGLLTTAGFRLP